jgi:hypothetical protein
MVLPQLTHIIERLLRLLRIVDAILQGECSKTISLLKPQQINL